MWSSHLVVLIAAVCAVAMSASAVAEAQNLSDDVWLLPVAVGVTSDTVVGSDVHHLGRSPHPADGQGSKSLARDYARILDPPQP
jgi:hypothetical protein